jgi:hypothetical protein
MGIDIHAHIEFVTPSGDVDWFAQVGIPRDHSLFAALAGVRYQADGTPLYPPRGLPNPCSDVVTREFYLAVSDRDDARLPTFRHVSRSVAERWVAEGTSQYVFGGRMIVDRELHTPSWLTLEEIEAALRHAKVDVPGVSPWFAATMAAMREFDLRSGSCVSRLVFWFDN